MSDRSSRWTLLELAVVCALIFAKVWLAPLLGHEKVTSRRIGNCFAVAGLAVAIASNVRHRDSLKDIGLRVDNFPCAIRLLIGPTFIIVAALLITGFCLHSINSGPRIVWFKSTRWLLPIVQQYLLQGFANRRLQDLCGQGRTSQLLTACVFSLLHLPNVSLMVATFIGGAIWAWVFQRQPNLFALTLSHVLISIVLLKTMPAWILPHMRIGWGYWR